MSVIYLVIAAFGGGVVAGLLGWLEKGTPFTVIKFLPTVLRALIAAGVVAASYPFIETMGFWAGLVGAFLAGAGVDVVGHPIAGIK